MLCHVYRSSVKDGLYVYVREDIKPEDLPKAVQKQLGKPELAMSLEITEDRKLSQEDPREVRQNLASQGFHVQMPRDDIESKISQMLSASPPTRPK